MRAALWSVGVCDSVGVAHITECLCGKHCMQGRMKGRRWAGGKWRTNEAHHSIVRLSQSHVGKKKEESLTRPERLMKRGGVKRKDKCSSGREEAVNIEKRLQHLVKQKNKT